MLEEQALLIAVPMRHLESALTSSGESTVLPAGGPGDLDSMAPGAPVLVMPTDTDDTDISAATWRATFVRRVAYQPGSPWPEGLPLSWTAEHPAPEPVAPASGTPHDPHVDPDDDPDPDDEDVWDDDEDAGPQSFLEVVDLGPMPRREWLFANELVGKQARGGRYFRPRVPTLVAMPD